MKHFFIALLTFCSVGLTAQMVSEGSFEGVFNQAAVFDMSPVGRDIDRTMTEEAKKKLLMKQYLTQAYNTAYIDDFKTLALLRYNMYNDQMEFVKNEQIFYMKKEKGRKVRFNLLNQLYKVYEVYGDLEFFLVEVDGKQASLLVKQSVRFVEPKKATSQYTRSREADFKRRNDEYFIAFGDKVVKVPRKRKDLHEIFANQTKSVKAYIKKEKINPKRLEDLKQLVDYYNSL